MGSMFGHVAPGTGFLLIGLWHLFNHIKLYAIHPSSYSAPPWFPLSNPRYRYLEPYVIMASATSSILAELFVGPHRHQPLDFDGTIPSNHLHNFEHASISLAILVYGAFTVLINKISPKTPAWTISSPPSPLRKIFSSSTFTPPTTRVPRDNTTSFYSS